MNKIKKVVTFIFDKTPFLRVSVKFVLDELASLAIYLSLKIGVLYTALFGFLGTSWFDHRYDQLRGVRNYHWLERAFFTLPKISNKDAVLEIGCGDGIYSGVFYSENAKNVVAVDLDQTAIDHAKKYYKKSNVTFLKKDVLTWNIPPKKYDVIVMFSVLEHLEAQDGLKVLRKVKTSLKDRGVFFGSTPIISSLGIANWEHKKEFTSAEQLKSFLKMVFRDVKISKSLWAKERPECYFECK